MDSPLVIPPAHEVGEIVQSSDQMDRVFSKFSERELKAMCESSDEIARILGMEPSKSDYVDAFGRANVIQEGSKWRVRVTDPSWGEAKNRKRLHLYLEMTEPKRRREVERGMRFNAERETETVRDARTDQVRVIPAIAVARGASRGWLKAVRQHVRMGA